MFVANGQRHQLQLRINPHIGNYEFALPRVQKRKCVLYTRMTLSSMREGERAGQCFFTI